MTVAVDLGVDPAGRACTLDLEELLATRLLVQGNSGSGKSHLLRRLVEQSAAWIQQVVIDPEGDFVTLADTFGHLVVEGADHAEGEIARIAARVREHRRSVVLSLEGLDAEAQMRCAATFLSALFDAPRDHWYPALIVVDEAQLFAPAVGGDVGEEVRKASLGAMTNLMCRGRKRGLAGVIATQRLAKLAKNVAAEASNFLMGRTFLDIDMARAADLLGMERRQAEQIRDLERGHFLALGPALSRRPLAVRIGEVETRPRSGSFQLVPLPSAPADEQADQMMLFVHPPAPRAAAVAKPAPQELEAALALPALAPAPTDDRPAIPADERETIIAAVLADMIADEDSAFRPAPILYQDFLVRCRMRRLADAGIDLSDFKARLSMARAGVSPEDNDAGWTQATGISDTLSEDLRGVFLLLARAARDALPCPTDDAVAEVYGTRSPARARRLLGYMDAQGAIAMRTDMKGLRSIAIPALGWTTAPA